MIVTAPPATATLTATVESDGWTPVESAWAVIAGAAGVTIDDPTAASTTATFPEPGPYVLEFTASAEQSGLFLTTLDGAVLVGVDGKAFAVQGNSVGFSDPVSASAQLHVTVVDIAAPLVRPEPVGADLHILIDDVEYAIGALDPIMGATLDSITETSDPTPNTATLVVRGFTPTAGQSVVITLDDDRIFAGRVIRDEETVRERWEIVDDHITVVDHLWDFKRRRITAKFKDASIATVAAAIVATAPGFSLVSVQGSSTPVTISYDSVDCASALQQACDQVPGFSFKIDYVKHVRVGAYDLVTAAPDPITRAHPTVNDFKRQAELGQWVTDVRVIGASTQVAVDTPMYTAGLLIAAADVHAFGTTGSPVLIQLADVTHEASFGGVETRTPALLPVAADLVSDPADLIGSPTTACLTEEDVLRHTLVQVNARAIVVTATEEKPGLAQGEWTYYVTYVTNRGETHWMQQLVVGVGGTGVRMSSGPAGSVIVGPAPEIKYNAVEFVCSAVPPVLQRLNIYRRTTAPGGGSVDVAKDCVLVGSLTAKGKLGDLGTHTGEENTDRAPGQPPWVADPEPGVAWVQMWHPVNIGKVADPSSNTLVDAGDRLPGEVPLTMPTADIPLPACRPEEAAAGTADAPGAIPPTPPPDETWLTDIVLGYPVPAGATVTRYLDVVDGAARAVLAARLDDDGIIVGEPLRGDYKSMSEMQNAGRAYLAARNRSLQGVSWTSRDRRTHPTLIIGVSVPQPAVSGEFVIKTVTITQFETVGCANGQKSYPLYTATAEPRYASIVGRL